MIQTYVVCFGELLWDMLPAGKVAGGAPFNIVNRINALGTQAYVISSIGRDELGDELLELVNEKGNNTSFIQRHNSLPTSQVVVSVGDRGEPSYDIVHPVAWDDINISEDIKSLVSSSSAFIYSSLGLRDARSREALFEILPLAKWKICDINLRDGHYSKMTILRMLEHADVIKMNEEELSMTCTWLDIRAETFEEKVKAIFEKYECNGVIATLGGDGAVSYDGEGFYRQSVFSVEIKDTVGAGDAFLASYITKKLEGAKEDEALRFGCAVGALTASKNGGTPIITTPEICNLLSL